tara:strand:- start:153 stop:2051 length:1899 start_codon:yes stop_codon:yes gene_type:complete
MKIILNEKQIKSIALLEEQNKPVIPQACKAYYSDTEPTYYVDNQQNRNLNRVGKQKGVKVVMSDKMRPVFELCYELNRNQQKYKQSIMFPLVSAIVNHKKDKWVDAVGEKEIKRVHDVLDKLHAIDPNKLYRWPEHLDDLTAGKRATYKNGTPLEFKDRLKDQAFLYDVDDSDVKQWLSVNKLDGNYADASKFITDIILHYYGRDTVEQIIGELKTNDRSTLLRVVQELQTYEEGAIFDAFLKDDTEYDKWATYYSEQGEEVENYVADALRQDGYEIIHQGGGGDPIDVLLGIDLIVTKGGNIYTCQVKKVAAIAHQAETTLKTCEEGGAYRIAPGSLSLSIRQKQNLDWVGYGTLDGKAIVSARQREVEGTYQTGFSWGDGVDLPVGRGYFFIDDPIATLNIPRKECESEEEPVVESSIKIKITEHQAEKLKEKDSQERRIKAMLKDMVGRAPWLVEEGFEEGYFGPDPSTHGGPPGFAKSYKWDKEVMEEIIEPTYRLYGFNEDEKAFVFTLFTQNMANSPNQTFTEIITPSPFPFKTGNFNVMGTSRQGELDGYYKNEIEEVFGPPSWDQGSADDKVQVEWVIKFPDGTIATIYDYKQYNVDPEDIDYWSIGGRGPLAEYYVKKAMGII